MLLPATAPWLLQELWGSTVLLMITLGQSKNKKEMGKGKVSGEDWEGAGNSRGKERKAAGRLGPELVLHKFLSYWGFIPSYSTAACGCHPWRWNSTWASWTWDKWGKLGNQGQSQMSWKVHQVSGSLRL